MCAGAYTVLCLASYFVIVRLLRISPAELMKGARVSKKSKFKVLGYRPKEVNKLILDSNTLVVVLGYLVGVPVLLASVTALMQSLTDSMRMTIPARLNVWYMLLDFVVVLITYQIAKLLSKRKVNRNPMSEALKAEPSDRKRAALNQLSGTMDPFPGSPISRPGKRKDQHE